jgi:gentisate 1,2-dioxygenase
MGKSEADPLLLALETRMAALNLRGQWQVDANRPQKVLKGERGQVYIEPLPAGTPHVWKWQDMLPLLEQSCEAMKESYTARRSLICTNPGLKRGTTQTLVAGFQVVKAGEIAWAHRHTINALRFTVQGGPKVFTVVDGRSLTMEPYDLILTPGWSWHDHHNEGDREAIWLDALDVPFTVGLNLSFYEELGEAAQEQRSRDSLSSLLYRPAGRKDEAAPRPYRYPWQDTLRALEALAQDGVDPYRGRTVEYVNPLTGGPALPTISCQVQQLPPGFEGKVLRATSSSIAFVVGGEGRTVFADREIEWRPHDCLAVPNWTWHRHINRSAREPAILFTLSDDPILSAFGFYREEAEGGAAVLSPRRPAARLSAAE